MRTRTARTGQGTAVRNPWLVVPAVIAAIVIQFVMVSAYAWSVTAAGPRGVPVAVSGPPAAVAALQAQAGHAHPGALRFVPAASPAAARQDITDRSVYGAIIMDGQSPRVLTASAASPAIAGILTSISASLSGAPAAPAHVTDVVPADPHDPGGSAFAFIMLPLIITSIIAGVLISLAAGSASAAAVSLAAFGIGGGAATTAAAHTWLSVLPGSYLALTCVTALIALAIAAGVAGLGALANRAGKMVAGFGLGAALIMLIGNPFAGLATAPEMVPSGWSTVGRLLPPGAGASLLRGVAYFNGARTAGQWIVLSTWAAAGLLLVLVAAVRVRRTSPSTGAHATMTA